MREDRRLGHLERLHGTNSGHERLSPRLRRHQKVPELQPQWLFLAHLDSLRVVLLRDVVRVRRLERTEGARLNVIACSV